MAFDEISVAAFIQIYGRDVSLIDVREVGEYESGHIAGAINIPLSEFAGRIAEIPGNTVYLICRSGARSSQACELCIDAGLVNVKNIVGGTLGWINAGQEVALGGEPG